MYSICDRNCARLAFFCSAMSVATILNDIAAHKFSSSVSKSMRLVNTYVKTQTMLTHSVHWLYWQWFQQQKAAAAAYRQSPRIDWDRKSINGYLLEKNCMYWYGLAASRFFYCFISFHIFQFFFACFCFLLQKKKYVLELLALEHGTGVSNIIVLQGVIES